MMSYSRVRPRRAIFKSLYRFRRFACSLSQSFRSQLLPLGVPIRRELSRFSQSTHKDCPKPKPRPPQPPFTKAPLLQRQQRVVHLSLDKREQLGVGQGAEVLVAVHVELLRGANDTHGDRHAHFADL